MRFFARAVSISLVVMPALLSLGWYCLTLQWRNPLPYPVMDAWFVLATVGLGIEQIVGYIPSEMDPSWWHAAIVIGSASISWAILCGIVATIACRLWRAVRPKPKMHV